MRIDHFKGFSDFWEIPGGDTTARNGHWESAPGLALFAAVREALGELPIIAENLGYIDEKAEQLLASTAFPGMKILEFGLLTLPAKAVIYHIIMIVTVWFILVRMITKWLMVGMQTLRKNKLLL